MLNRAAREVWEKLGQLSGPELETPGGRRYRAGDRVITLSPGPRGAWVNSQRAVVKSVDLDRSSLVAVTSEGTELHMGPKDIGADQLGYSFGLTAHQAHGATVDATYALADGGGRELAHVAMSRARDESHVHVVAPNPAEAAQRVAWAGGHERRQRWVLDQDRRRTAGQLVHRTPGSPRPWSCLTAPPTWAKPDGNWRAPSRTRRTSAPAPGAGPTAPPA